MTTTTATPELRTDQEPPRLLSIAANLLPSEITDARRERKLRGFVAAFLVLVLVGLVGWDVLARRGSSTASTALAQAQAQTVTLQSQQKSFADLNKVKAADKAITTELNTLMAKDMAWYTLLPQFHAAAPAGVTITNVQVTLAAADPSSATSGTGTSNGGSFPGLTSSAQIGTVVVVGTASDKPHIATYLEHLAKIKGVADVYFSSAITEKDSYQFTINMELTSAVLGGRYANTTPTTGAH
jgi:hypothetical protein